MILNQHGSAYIDKSKAAIHNEETTTSPTRPSNVAKHKFDATRLIRKMKKGQLVRAAVNQQSLNFARVDEEVILEDLRKSMPNEAISMRGGEFNNKMEFRKRINYQYAGEDSEGKIVNRLAKMLNKRNRNDKLNSPIVIREQKQKTYQLSFSTNRTSQPILRKVNKYSDNASPSFGNLPSLDRLNKHQNSNQSHLKFSNKPLINPIQFIAAKHLDVKKDANLFRSNKDDPVHFAQIKRYESRSKLKVPLSPYEQRINLLKKQLLSDNIEHNSNSKLELQVLEDFNNFYH